MAIRSDLIEVEPIYDKIGIDIIDIENEIFTFDNKINSITNANIKAISRLQECILHFRNARNKLRSILKVEENKYIHEETLSHIDTNIGNLDTDIGRKEKELLAKVKELDFYKKSEERNIKLNPLKSLLKEAMEILVIGCMIKAAQKWDLYDEKNGEDILNEKDGKETGEKAIKDIYLFNYYLFQEMIPASTSIGAFERQEIKAYPKNINVYNKNPIQQRTEEQSQETGTTEEASPKSDLFPEDVEKDELY